MAGEAEPIEILKVCEPHRGWKCVIFIHPGRRLVGSLPVPKNLPESQILAYIKEALGE